MKVHALPGRFFGVAGLLLILGGLSCRSTGDFNAVYEQGADEFRLGNFSAARAKFSDLLKNYPDHPSIDRVRARLAGCEQMLGNGAAARKLYQELENSKDVQMQVLALEALGSLENQQGNYPAAVDYFRRSVQLEKNPAQRPHLQFNLALALQRSGNFTEGKRVFEDVVAASPDPRTVAAARDRLTYPDYFTIQVGAYEKDNAEKQQRALSPLGHPVAIAPVARPPGQTLYRVHLGRFPTRPEALSARDRLAASAKIPKDSEVVP